MTSPIVIAGIYSRSTDATPEPEDEYLVLLNTGESPVSLAGWTITNRKADQCDHFRFHFPRFLANGCDWVLEPQGMVFVHTGRGCSSSVASGQYHVYQHRTIRVWAESGDTACLYDPSGTMVTSFEFAGARQTA